MKCETGKGSIYSSYFSSSENAILTHGPRNGSIFISDWTGASFGHLFRASISSIRKSLDFIQHASPMKMRAVHILNSSYLIQVLFCKLRFKTNMLSQARSQGSLLGKSLKKLQKSLP